MPNRERTMSTLIPASTVSQIEQAILVHEGDCRVQWRSRLATMDLGAPAKEQLQGLFHFLLEHFVHLLRGDEETLRSFQLQVLRAQPLLGAADFILLLADFEEILMSVIWKTVAPNDVESVFRWVHSVIVHIGRSTMRSAYFPMRSPAVARKEDWESPFSRLLNGLALAGDWSWLAIVHRSTHSSSPLQIRELAVYNTLQQRWRHAPPSPEWVQEISEAEASEETVSGDVGPDLVVVARGRRDAVGRYLIHQVANWLRIAIDLSWYREQAGPDQSRLALYERLLELDDVLLAADDLEDVLRAIATHVCRSGHFTRSALFVYNPFTRTLEGVYGYNVSVEDVQRIRESARNIPDLRYLEKLTRPLYYRDVSTTIPKYYVEHFHLRSLLVCPLIDNNQRPLGILLLDKSGEPFDPDEDAIALADVLTRRAAKILGAHLYRFTQPPEQRLQTATELTDREREVLQYIADGLGTKQVAAQLHISEYTVTEHVTSSLRKLGAQNRTEAVAIALRAGWIR
jgi:DNA-binding CsgD family transcriptional regulator